MNPIRQRASLVVGAPVRYITDYHPAPGWVSQLRVVNQLRALTDEATDPRDRGIAIARFWQGMADRYRKEEGATRPADDGWMGRPGPEDGGRYE